MSKPLSTTFVTDVPFWEKKTGAQSRILQLVEQLNCNPLKTGTLISQWKPEVDFDQVRLQHDFPIELIDPSRPPESGIRAKTSWYVRAVSNRVGIRQSTDWKPTLTNYYPKPIVDRFVQQITQAKPDILIFEYVNQIQLLRALPKGFRESTVCAVDTHDVLWRRTEQFRQNGQSHWIDADRSDEEKALSEFDLIIAIQSKEGEYFSTLVDPDKVIVTAMEFAPQSELNTPSNTSTISIGMLSSNNWANIETVRQITTHWPAISAENPLLEFVLAGSICNSEKVVEWTRNLDRFRLLGQVDSTKEFYDQVEAIWNPVHFGTGLKIKNLEALAFAKCLITSPHGAEGMEFHLTPNRHATDPFVVLRSESDITAFFRGLNQDIIRQTRDNGIKHLKSHFGVGTQYPKLRQRLASLSSLKSS